MKLLQEENLLVGAAYSEYAVCSLWSDNRGIARRLKERGEEPAITANLYGVGGIDYILANLMRLPTIRTIFLVGEDRSAAKAGHVLVRLWQNRGVLPDGDFAFDPAITPRIQSLVFANVELIDLRHVGRSAEAMVAAIIARIPPHKAAGFWAEAEEVCLEKDKPNRDLGFPTGLPDDESGRIIRGPSIGRLWAMGLTQTLRHGVLKPTQYGGYQRETLNVLFELDRDSTETSAAPRLLPEMNVPEEAVREYCAAILSGTKDEGVAYTYGERIRHFQSAGMERATDQFANAETLLKSDRASRRAFISLWDVAHDAASANPPCLDSLCFTVVPNADRSIKPGLHLSALFRSNDGKAFVTNAYGLRALQEEMARRLDLPVGGLSILAHSFHIYAADFDWAAVAAEKYGSDPRRLSDNLDPRGYWHISLATRPLPHNPELEPRKGILCRHGTDKGYSGIEVFDTDAKMTWFWMGVENLVSQVDHAAYLYGELIRAEHCIVFDKPFVQDEYPMSMYWRIAEALEGKGVEE